MKRVLAAAALPAVAVAVALGLRGDASPPPSGSLQRFDVAVLPGRDRVIVAFSKEGLGRLEDARAEADLLDAQGRAARSGRLDHFDAGVEALSLDTSGLEPGAYKVVARLRAGERLLQEHRQELRLEPRPEWLGHALGKLGPDEVPPPWSPMSVRGTDVSVWNREYRVGRALLPTEISSAGAQLLSRPIRLVAVVNGQRVSSGAAEVRVVAASRSRVELEARGALGGLAARTRTAIEFDGFAWVELTLEPTGRAGRADVSELSLEIPLRPAHATLYNSDRQDLHGTGATERAFATRYDPVRQRVVSAWIGDEARGIHWCAESDQGWRLARPSSAIGYERHDDEVVLRIRFIDRSTRLEGPLKLAFGLEATPARPPSTGWRRWRFGSGEDVGAMSPAGAGQTHPGPSRTNLGYAVSYWSRFARSRYPEAAPDTRSRLDALRAQGVEPVLDSSLVWTYPLGPEYRSFLDEWHPAPFLWPDLAKMAPARDWLEYPGSPSARSYADWQLFMLDRLLAALALKAIYFDMSAPLLNGRFASGSGFQDPARGWPPLGGYVARGYGAAKPDRRLIDVVGHYHPQTEILATRDLFKRFYVLAKRRDPRFLILLHGSGDRLPGIQAFVDGVVDGEQLRGSMRSASYERTLSYDVFRAAFMGQNHGPVTLLLPEFSASARERGEDPAFWESRAAWPRIRHLLGLILLHDGQVVPAFSGFDPYDQIRAAQDEFGQWDDAMEFIPYWASEQLVRLEPARLLACSIFRGRPSPATPARTLLVVFNDSDEEAAPELTLELTALGTSAQRLRDLLGGETFPLRGPAARPRARVPLAKRDFRMLLLE